MTGVYLILAALAFVMWAFSMLAAFFLGSFATMAKQQQSRERLLSGLKDILANLKGETHE